MNIDFKQLVKPYEKTALKELSKWIQINSIFDQDTVSEKTPFGKGVAEALEFIATLAEKEGFVVDRCDNYCTEISYGEGELIAIYAHADVVPVSDNWDDEPFSGAIKSERVVGRGTSDDKGPAMAAFYALKALKDSNLIKNYKVTLVIGGNEESGSACLEHYFNVLKKPYPKYGFTPDGSFPLIYGEKGISNYSASLKIDLPNVLSIDAGLVANSVIDKAEAVLKTDSHLLSSIKKYFEATSLNFEITNINESTIRLVVLGRAAHGSTPLLGLNAGLGLLKFLGIHYHSTILEKIADNYLDATGEKMGVYACSEMLHETTFNVGLISYKDGVLSCVVNFRYPETVNVNETIKAIEELNLGSITLLSESKPLLIDPKSDMVQGLLKVYQEETGDLTTPIMTIGGGTYAKESKNTLAFGSAFPGSDDHIHDKNEHIMLKDFYSSMSIYAHAIYHLGNLK